VKPSSPVPRGTRGTSRISSGADKVTTTQNAIVAASFVEDHLQRLIQSRMVSDKKVLEQMFGPNSALGSFSAKINLGFLMGIYSKNAWRELDTIRTIRNDFAHELAINSFDILSVRDRCAHLTLWQTRKITIRAADDLPPPKKLVVEMGQTVGPEAQELVLELITDLDTNSPHGRYVAACRFFIAAFSLLVNMGGAPKAAEL